MKDNIFVEDKSIQKIRILLAEDNKVNQIVAISVLNRLGYKTDVAVNGMEAVAALKSVEYDMILMDVQMPIMDGFEATRNIRNPDTNVKNPNIPIIAMTASAMKGDREQCLKAGMNDYISKPFQLKELAETISRNISNPSKAKCEKIGGSCGN